MPFKEKEKERIGQVRVVILHALDAGLRESFPEYRPPHVVIVMAMGLISSSKWQEDGRELNSR
jgi:hypothetical protein